MGETVEKIKKFVLEECKKPTSKYGVEPFEMHFSVVVKYVKLLAAERRLDVELMEIAAWLHDIGSIVYGRENHHETGTKIAEKKLRELGYPKNKINVVKKCILNHRGSLNLKRESVEEETLAEADVLSNFENIAGILEAAIKWEGMSQKQASFEVYRKLKNKWKQLSPDLRKLVSEKYIAVKILFGGENAG